MEKEGLISRLAIDVYLKCGYKHSPLVCMNLVKNHIKKGFKFVNTNGYPSSDCVNKTFTVIYVGFDNNFYGALILYNGVNFQNYPFNVICYHQKSD